MFIPVGTYTQYIQQIDKDEHGNVTQKQVMGVSVSTDGHSIYLSCKRTIGRLVRAPHGPSKVDTLVGNLSKEKVEPA